MRRKINGFLSLSGLTLKWHGYGEGYRPIVLRHGLRDLRINNYGEGIASAAALLPRPRNLAERQTEGIMRSDISSRYSLNYEVELWALKLGEVIPEDQH
jgi:hypothetical protein